MSNTRSEFKISPNWHCRLTFDQIIADARFIFSIEGDCNKCPRVVMKYPFEDMNCIEISYDQYGLITGAETIFNARWGGAIIDSGKDCINFIKAFLVKVGAEEFIIQS